MSRGFINGLLTGGLIGAVVGLMAFPNSQRTARRYAGKSRRMMHQSNRMMGKITDNVKDWLD